jgi:hypothetical protein
MRPGQVFAPPRLKMTLAASVVAFGGIGAGWALSASASSPQVLAIQSSSQYVFACVSEKSGAVEYFEFRTPLPHQCDADDELWHLAAAPTASPTTCTSPTLTATATATATPTSTACASAAALSSPTPDVLSSSGLESSVPLASPPPSAS